jgi:hypothetical protein
LKEDGAFFFVLPQVVYPSPKEALMAKNDRFVVKHEEGWAVKKTNGRTSQFCS